MNKKQHIRRIPAKYLALFSLIAALAAFGIIAQWARPANAQDIGLEVTVIAGYNLVVDSNVKSPSTYAPSVATVAVKYCNKSGSQMNNVVGYIGEYTGVGSTKGTPGTYPKRIADAAFKTTYDWQTDITGNINYKFTHLGSSLNDAVRYIGTLENNACSVQYWSFSYPQCENNGPTPCTLDPVWGVTNSTSDDLWLRFDAWGKNDTGFTDPVAWKMTMRNEISAMANKIEPNPNGLWFNTDTSVVNAGDVITTNGVNYTFGNINKGFDNDGDLAYDYNAWMQPFGAPTYDPSCFRLIRTSGTVTVTRSGGNPPNIINFVDQLYFTSPQITADNTNVTGRVYYTFLALGGRCTTAMSPYQEAASGANNEKFNGDYGTGIPPLVSSAPAMTFSKNGESLAKAGDTVTYNIPFANIGNTDIGLNLSSGFGVVMPLTIEDTVPAKTQYVCDSADTGNNQLFYSSAPIPPFTVLYSNDSGGTWSDNENSTFTECADTNPSTNPTSNTGNIKLRWMLNDPLPKTSASNTSSGSVQFKVIIPSVAANGGSPIITNTACANLGGAVLPLACDDQVTLIKGNNSIGDFVWKDENGDGLQAGETGIANVTVRLYLDSNGNGSLDAGEPQLNTAPVNIIDGYLNMDGDAVTNNDDGDDGKFDGYAIYNGRVDVDNDGDTDANDDGGAIIDGYDVIDGYIDFNGNGAISTVISGGKIDLDLDDNFTNDSGDTGLFGGYSLIKGLVDVDGDGQITSDDDGTGIIAGLNVKDGYVVDGSNNALTTTIRDLNDDGSVNRATTVSSGSVSITNGALPGGITTFAGFNVVGGKIDVDGNGSIDAFDAVTPDPAGGGFPIVNGCIDSCTWSGTLSGIYGFAYLPDAKYIVQVITSDSAIPTGYTPTTVKQYAVDLPAGGATHKRAVDFGFGPTLRIDKHLETLDPAVVGELVTFDIDLTNLLPGDGTPSGYCRYKVWATKYNAYQSNNVPESGSSGNNSLWSPPDNALNRPDGAYALTGMRATKDDLGLNGFNKGGLQGTSVRSVKLLFYFTEVAEMQSSDYVTWQVYKNNLNTGLPTGNLTGAAHFTKVVGSDYELETAALAGTWNISDFQNDYTELFLTTSSSNTSGDVGLDAVAYLVETDALCSSAETTISTLPLSDVYDADKLQFVSANPPPTSNTTGGTSPFANTGTLTWNNVGTLYAGGTRQVKITFKAKATTTIPSDDMATSANAKFATGRAVNTPVSDSASVNITTAGSISGYIWSDRATTGWQGSTGWDTTGATPDTFIPGATVELWGCVSNLTGLLLNESTDGNGGKACTNSANNGTWVKITSRVTNSSGYYIFDGLRPGYYDIRVVQTSLPAGYQSAASRQTEPSPTTANAGDSNCNTGGTGCDNQWNSDDGNNTIQLDNLREVGDATNGYTIQNVSFGYQDDADNQGAVIGYVWRDDNSNNVWDWTDSNNNGVWDAGEGEPPIPGVTVYLCSDAGDDPCDATSANYGPVTTDANGRYTFGNLPTGSNYRVGVVPFGMTQTGDPDTGGQCSTCDNQTTTAFSVAANQVVSTNGTRPLNFGYTGGYSIGDTIYTDWNGDGIQGDGNSGNGTEGEPGIDGVKVTLYRDHPTLGTVGVYDAGIDIYVSETTTSGGGAYSFTNLPGGTNDYIVVVNPSTVPAGYRQTGDPEGGCPSGTTCDGSDFIPNLSGNYSSADFGYQPRGAATIGDLVWIDTDGDGVQDQSELGQADVTINLYHDTDGDGIIDVTDDAKIATTTTLGYSILDGYINKDGDLVANEADDSIAGGLYGYNIINGAIDINGDNSITSSDDGYFGPYRVIDGRLDMNGDGYATTTDDGSLLGFYLFNNLPAGNYIVQIDENEFGSSGTLEKYTMTTTGTGYNINQVSRSATLIGGQQFYEADFGFATSAIGDFVWQDTNGDGNQDSSEPGINDVILELYRDLNGDGDADDPGETTAIATTTTATDPATSKPGYYRFTGLDAGDYIVKIAAAEVNFGGTLYNYVGTYDPDAYNVPCVGISATGCDNQSVINLAVGQTDLTSDFGFRLPGGRVGDSVWVDINQDGVRDPNEPGIKNITVELCADVDCTSVIATTSTDNDGYYSFGNIPASATRYVQVRTDDPDLSGYTQTYETNNGGAGDSNASVDNVIQVVYNGSALVSSINGTACTTCEMNVDFGFKYAVSGAYSISGTVFFDTEGNGGPYDNNGIAPDDKPYSGITVYLYSYTDSNNNDNWDPGEPIVQLKSTTTNSSGLYTFGSLPAGDYVVSVSNTTFSGMTRKYEADSTYNGWTPVTISTAPVDTRDFGFYALMDCGDLPASFNYRTTLSVEGPCHVNTSGNLKPGIYLGSNWDGESDGQGETTVIADGDDQTNSDEDGITLTSWQNWRPGNQDRQLEANVVGSNAYLAGWFDWNRDGNFITDSGAYDAGEYVYFGAVNSGNNTLTVDIPSCSAPNCFWDGAYVYLYYRFRVYKGSSPPPVVAPTGLVVDGEVEDYYNTNNPTAITLADFSATSSMGQAAIRWQTTMEYNTIGFNLYRSTSRTSPRTQLNPELIMGQIGNMIGGEYEFIDPNIQYNVTYYYWLEEIDADGRSTFYGPVAVTTYGIYLPLAIK